MTGHDQRATEPHPTRRDDELAGDGLGACFIWYRVLTVQADRLARSGSVPDGYVFVVALRNLRRAAVLVTSALTHVEGRRAAVAALAEFDRILPAVEEARDMFEHLDDYADGGAPGHRPAPPSPVTVDLRPAHGGRQLVLRVGEAVVPVDEAITAGCLLLADVHAAAHPDDRATESPRDEAAHRVLPGAPELAA